MKTGKGKAKAAPKRSAKASAGPIAARPRKTGRKKTAASTADQFGVSKAQISAAQWELPASYTADGTRLATLRELADPAVATMSLAQMNAEQKAEVVAKRIELQPQFEIAMVGAGIVDKERAIEEVKAQTDVGRVLTEIEQNAINFMLAAAQAKGSHGP